MYRPGQVHQWSLSNYDSCRVEQFIQVKAKTYQIRNILHSDNGLRSKLQLITSSH